MRRFPRKRSPIQRFRRGAFESLETRNLLAFGVTTGTTPTGQSTYVIDNGGDLKFAVIKGGSLTSTIHMGDISSIQYKNQEILATYAVTSRYSHYEQGLGSITTITNSIVNNNNANDYILVKCDDSAEASGAVIQYYAVRRNDNNIYMASLPIDVTNGPGEGRFIGYLSRTVFPNPEAPSDNNGNSGAIEGSDVFGHADGTTTSKFYNMGRRMIENIYHGVTGSSGGVSVGAWMYMGNREHSAGGPFFKDIDFQSGSAVEIYNCIFTGHTQTEAYRQGLHVYAFQFTNSSAPVTPDYSWMEALNLQGWIPAAQRGALTGTVYGIPAGRESTVYLSNTTAQYWGTPDASGHYAITGIQPGTYTETLYLDELAVGTRSVTISAGQTLTADIANTLYTPSAANTIFRIGTWDGTPIGFLNSDIADAPSGARRIEIMHPSDVRMTSWTSTPNFVVGTNTDDQWPMIQFMGVNNSQRITFNLTSAQVQNLTLRIGVTLGFEGGRNKVTVNSGQSYVWTSANPSASTDLNSRGITRGTWRGPNQLYVFNIPSSALRAGTNTIDLPVISGSYVAGQTWLSPNVVYDAIDLVTTTSASVPAIASVTITPANSNIGTNGARTFTAVAKDASGNVLAANFAWSATRGTIDANGNYIAPATEGSDTISVTATITRTPGYSVSSSSSSAVSGSVTGNGNTTVNVIAPPTLTAAVSRKTQGSTAYDLTLPLSGSPAVEARIGGPTTLILTFGQALNTSAALTLSLTAGTGSASYLGSTQVSISLSGATDGATLGVTLSGVQRPGGAAGSYSLNVGVLAGDVDGSEAVNVADVLTTKLNSGAALGAANFLVDLNGDGSINVADVITAKLNSGHFLVGGGGLAGSGDQTPQIVSVQSDSAAAAPIENGAATLLAARDPQPALAPSAIQTVTPSVSGASPLPETVLPALTDMLSASSTIECAAAETADISDQTECPSAPPTAVTSLKGPIPTSAQTHRSSAESQIALTNTIRDAIFASGGYDALLSTGVGHRKKNRFSFPK